MKNKNTSQRRYVIYFSFIFIVATAVVVGFSQTARAAVSSITSVFTTTLTDSGSSVPLPVLSDATEPNESGLTPALQVNQPNAMCPKMLGVINPSIALPTNSTIRQIEAFFNGTPLPLVDDHGKIIEEAHSWGSTIPFWRPLFSVAGVPAGQGTLEIKGFNASHTPVATVSVPNLTVAVPPTPVSLGALTAIAHPRIYLTPQRIIAMQARTASDPFAERFWGQSGIGWFLDALKVSPDPEDPGFVHYVWDPEDYVPALALCYQLKKDSDPTTAQTCASAAKRMTLKMAADYANGTRSFARDTGYDIRFGLRDLMLSYDWLYSQYTSAERTQIVNVATNWVDWYTNNHGYADTNPANNYYAGYLQGIMLTAVATAGDNTASARFLTLLRDKLTNEVPILNQRACGDWPEGWNYGPYTMIEYALINQTLKDVGENWGASFNFLDSVGRSLTYQITPDFSQTLPFGGYSGNLAHKTSPALLAVLSGTTPDGAAASRLYQNMLANPDNDWSESRGNTVYEMIFGNLPPTLNVSGWPLSRLNPGTGRFFSKSSLTDPSAYLVTVENSNAHYDHFGYSNGDVRLYRGSTCLLCPTAYRGEDFGGEDSSVAFSTYEVNGKIQSQNRNNQILFTKENTDWSAIGMRLESSWAISRYDESFIDTQNPLNYLIREVVHIRPGTVIVRDLHQRRHTSDTMIARWHLGSSSAVQTTDSNHYQIDNLKISTFYPAGVATVFAVDKNAGGNTVGKLMQQTLPASTAAMEMITVFSETISATGYANGVLHLSDNQCVTFGNGTVYVSPCGNLPVIVIPPPVVVPPPVVPPAPVSTPPVIPTPPSSPTTPPSPSTPPATTPTTPSSVPTTPAPTTKPDAPIKTNVNLIQDPGFEKGVSGFFAQESIDYVKRITAGRLTGKGSLQLKLTGWGNHIWWQLPNENTVLTYGGTLQFIASVRPDVKSKTPLRMCAAVYYANGEFVKQCVTPSKTKNFVSRITATLKIAAKRKLASVNVFIYNDGPGPILYTLDNTSLKLFANPKSAVKK